MSLLPAPAYKPAPGHHKRFQNVLDKIYQSTHKNIKVKLLNSRIDNLEQEKSKQKTLAMERMERIESNVNEAFEDNSKLGKQMNVVQINDQAITGKKEKFHTEKMKGRFKVTINKDLAKEKQI